MALPLGQVQVLINPTEMNKKYKNDVSMTGLNPRSAKVL